MSRVIEKRGKSKGAEISAAVFSKCEKYRYTLTRVWDTTKPLVAFVGLNPSTADESANDPTIRRCINYAKLWGYGGMVMLNIFAYRSTDPRRLLEVEDPVGDMNDIWLRRVRNSRAIHEIIACWGVNGTLNDRDQEVKAIFKDKLQVLGLSKEGHPRHPLYLQNNLMPVSWKNVNVKNMAEVTKFHFEPIKVVK